MRPDTLRSPRTIYEVISVIERLVDEINRIQHGEDRWNEFIRLAEQAPGPTQGYMIVAVSYLSMTPRTA